jgi:hypothetical protein
MGYLFIGYNRTEDFRILICAYDIEEAAELAEGYRVDARLDGVFEISEADKIDNIYFDCDYVII